MHLNKLLISLCIVDRITDYGKAESVVKRSAVVTGVVVYSLRGTFCPMSYLAADTAAYIALPRAVLQKARAVFIKLRTL